MKPASISAFGALVIILTQTEARPDQIAWPDNPRAAESVLEIELIIPAVEAAHSLKAEPDSDAARKRYQILDSLGELFVNAAEPLAEELTRTPHPEWTRRLILHFGTYHIGSANERWTEIIAKTCLADPESAFRAISELPPESRRAIQRHLTSPLNLYKKEKAKSFAKLLAGRE